MKTLKEFDYDLWATEENGTKRYFARVKATGEETEISLELMRVLMNEEKKMRREYAKNSEDGVALSLDVICTDSDTDEAAWLMDSVNVESDVISAIMEDEFVSLLTEKQRDVYLNCMKVRKTVRAYADESGKNFYAVQKTIEGIRIKYKKYFS